MTPSRSYLLFRLAGQRFGIALESAREVIRAVAITPLPGAPAAVEGVIDLRGRVIPVLDLRHRFALEPRPVSPDDQIVIAFVAGRPVALRVDRVEWMQAIDTSMVDRSAEAAEGAPHVAGIARLPDGLVLIHDLETFLAAAEAEALDAALAAAPPTE